MDKEELLKRTLEDLGKIYIDGLYEYLYECHREVYNEIIRLEEEIDQAFLSRTVGELKAVLRAYWKLHIQAIKEFKSSDQLDFNPLKARKEIAEERIRA